MDNNLMNKSGIYKITNLINNKIYIGSTNNFYYRKSAHLSKLKLNKHFNSHLQRSYNKYGKNNFKFEVIEYIVFPNNFNNFDIIETLINREQYYLDLYKSWNFNLGYNKRVIADSSAGYKVSEETKRKISVGNKGKKRSVETCLQMSVTKQKNNSYKRGLKVINTSDGTIYNTVEQARKVFNIKHRQKLMSWLTGKTPNKSPLKFLKDV